MKKLVSPSKIKIGYGQMLPSLESGINFSHSQMSVVHFSAPLQVLGSGCSSLQCLQLLFLQGYPIMFH